MTNAVAAPASAAPASGPTSVKDFGAVGNGTTDDTAALQAALNAAARGAGVVDVPAGTYRVTSTLTMAADVSLRGAGRGVSVLKGALSGPLLRSSNPAARFSNWLIRDIGFDNTNRGIAGGIGIDLTNVAHARLDNVTITNVETGVRMSEAAYYNEISTLHVSGAVTGVRIGGGAVSTNECLFTNLRLNDLTDGVIINNATNQTFVKPAVESFTGIGFDIAPTEAVQYTNLIGPRLENSSQTGIGVRNRLLAQATTIVGGMNAGLATTVANDAGLDQLIILVSGVSTPRVRTDNLLLTTRESNTGQIYAAGGTTYIRNGADSGYNTIDAGGAVVRGALEHIGGAVGFYGKRPVPKPVRTPRAATDLRSTTALVNDLRAKLLALGLIG
jgi:hypothetical protein